MLEKIYLRNFKSHKELDIDFAKINVFIGANNSGKSSIFQAMQLLKQNAVGGGNTLTNNKISIDIGDFEDVLRRNTNELTIKFFGKKENNNEELLKYNVKEIQIKYDIKFNENSIYESLGTIELGQFKFDWLWDFPPANEGFEIEIDTLFDTNGSSSLDEKATEALNLAFEKYFLNSLKKILKPTIPDFLKSLFFIPGIRGFEKNGYKLTKEKLKDFNFESVLLNDRNNIATNFIGQNRVFEEEVSNILDEYLGFRVIYENVGDNEIILKAKRGNNFRAFVSEGLGSQQLLSLFLPIAVPSLKTFFIEEPEAHLHPKLQSQVTEKLIDIALGEDKQIIMSTHSEHVLQKVLASINSGKLEPSDVRVYYTEKEDGTSKVTSQVPDKFGRLPNGLPGFFEHNLDEMGDYLENLSKNL